MSLLARLSFGLFDFAVVVLVERETGSFGVAGAVIGAHAAGISVSAPLRGRLLDRLGSRRLLPPMSVAHAAAIIGVAVCARLSGDWGVILVSFVGGVVIPPLVPAMRLEWQRLLGTGTAELERAYAFETSAQLGVFLVGPLLASAGLAASGPDLPLALSAALVLVAGPLFAARTLTRPDPARTATRGFGAITVSGVRTLVLVTLLADAALGIVDVAVIASATERGHPAAGGVLLALFTTGAVIGGIVYATRSWRMPGRHRLAMVLGMWVGALGALALAEPTLVLFAVGP